MTNCLLTLESGTTCTAWNNCGERLAAGSINGHLSIFDSPELAHSSSSSFTRSSKIRVHKDSAEITKVVWVPPDYGDAIVCIFNDGSFSIWEEASDEENTIRWKLCKSFTEVSAKPLDVQFGVIQNGLKMVVAYSNGLLKIFELMDCLELNKWQLQAEFQNIVDSTSSPLRPTCFSSSISWTPRRGDTQEPSFVVGFNSDTPQLNSPKVWEFDKAHNRWLPVAQLALPLERSDQVFAVAWAPNIGRPFEVIAVSTSKGIGIWQVGMDPDADGRLSVSRVALISEFEGEVWQMEWDAGGLSLATTGTDGIVRLWQSNLKGIWHQQVAFQPSS